jgi:TfoX/Sxy family transcriptional regulator of competence genes
VPYDEGLAERVRELLADRPDLTEKKMFGGIGFMLGGNMCCGVLGDELVARLGPDSETALAETHVRPFDFTGRPMSGFVLVGPGATETDDDLDRWVARCEAFASSLPPK